MPETKVQPAAATNVDFSSMISKGISDGVMMALQSKATAEANASDHASMMAQHAKVTGEDTKSSEFESSALNELNAINLKTLTIAETVQNKAEMFSAIPEKLNMIADTVGLLRSGLEGMADKAFGGTGNRALASSIIDSMGPNPVGDQMTAHAGVRSAFSRMVDGSGFPQQQSAKMSANVLPDNGKSGLAKKSTSASSTNTVENDRKVMLEEEDRAYKDAVRPVMPKLSQALDKYLSNDNVASAESSESGGFSLMNLMAMLGGGAVGLVAGYISKLASMWGEVGKAFASGIKAGWNVLKNSEIGKTIASWGTKLQNAISSGIAKISSLKQSFTNMINGWKTTMKESTVGKAAKGVLDSAKKAGGWIKGIFSKAGNAIANGAKKAGSAIASGAKKAGAAIASSKIAQNAIKAGKFAFKAAKKIPLVQAGVGLADTAMNVYNVAKNGGNITDIMSTGAAGLVDTLADTLMVPELINGVAGAVAAVQSGEGITGALKGFGSGVIKERDPNEISLGQGLVANVQHFAGNETETTKRIREAYNSGKGYKEAGLEVVSGTAGGFGHSAAVYKPKAAGSNENSNQPNATVAEAPTAKPKSEAEKNKELANMLEESVKNAYLSQEVQEANRQNAKETGSAINSQLMG